MVDMIGLGAGVVDRLKELKLPVFGVNVSESASNDDKYFRLRDELWWKGREWFISRSCRIPADEKLIAELASPLYDFNSNGQIIIESKKDMKKRGLKSPNKADAFLNTFARPDQQKKPIKRFRDKEREFSSWAA